MCGWLVLTNNFSTDDFDAGLATLERRGPDCRGVWRDEHVQMGHHRLSVQDLSADANQPMHSSDPDQRYVLVYNGEIYNGEDMLHRLVEYGFDPTTLRSSSDTEILLESLICLGMEETLELVDGMFAFVLYDRHERMIYAARDPLGIKPMFFSTSQGFAAASTMSPFWSLTNLPRRLNPQAVRDYLAAQSIFSPHSILENVHALDPGCWLSYELETGTLEVKRYWDIPSPKVEAKPFEQLVQEVDKALRESVRRQLVSDVPIGAFLSGGVDSSLMVHYMAELLGESRVRTFSVSFAGQGKYDESSQAKVVADKYGCDATVFNAEQLTAERFLDAVANLDQPLADPAYLPTLALSELTRKHVTVAVSGDGGDELFGGYGRFLETQASFPATGQTRFLAASSQVGLLPGSLWRRQLSGQDKVMWQRVRLGPYPTSRKALKQFVTREFYDAMQPSRTLEKWREQATRWSGEMDSDALMRADLWTYLSDNCLVKTDRASMHHSLEVRVPMLGRPVMDLVLPEPASVKLHGGMKGILLELSRRYLPREVWDRPKHGFSVPLDSYFRGPWREACDTLVEEASTLAPFLNEAAVRQQWRKCLTGGGDRRVMYSLLVMLQWLRTHPVD